MDKENMEIEVKEESPISERTKAIVSAAAVIIVNLVAYFFGTTLDASIITNGILAVILLVSTFWGIWKNHNFTPEAAAAQVVLNELKAAGKAE